MEDEDERVFEPEVELLLLAEQTGDVAGQVEQAEDRTVHLDAIIAVALDELVVDGTY